MEFLKDTIVPYESIIYLNEARPVAVLAAPKIRWRLSEVETCLFSEHESRHEQPKHIPQWEEDIFSRHGRAGRKVIRAVGLG